MNKFPEIMGFNKTSEAGFNLFAASIFLFGCNLRCPYCMNGRIVVVKPEDWEKPVKTIDLEVIKKHVLETRTEWVMISGGEPTFTPLDKLNNLIDEIRSWGCKIGISTNGTRPEIIEQILPKLNYVALDIKAYGTAAYAALDIKFRGTSWSRTMNTKYQLSMEKKNRNDFNYEVRTTLYPTYIKENDIDRIGGIMNKSEIWVLQQFRHAKNMLSDIEAREVTPYSEEIVNQLAKKAEQYVDKVIIRYV